MPRPKTTQPTNTHINILRVILKLIKGGYPPAIKEIADELQLAGPSSLVATLNVMARLGFVEYIGGGQRGKRKLISLTESGRAAAGQLGIPLLGSIPAGSLSDVLLNPEARLDLPLLVPFEEGDFLLNVNGESMTGDGILTGDLVLLRPNIHIHQGEIAAVHVGADYLATLKRVYFDSERKTVTLKASNPVFNDITAPINEVTVAGVFRGLIRNPTLYKGFISYGI